MSYENIKVETADGILRLTIDRPKVLNALNAQTVGEIDRAFHEARKEAQAALDAPLDPNWTPEDRRFKEQAKRLLRDLQR